MDGFKVKAKIEKIMKMDENTAFCIARAVPIDKDFDKKYLNMYGNFSVLGNAYLMEDMEYEFIGTWQKSPYGFTLNFSAYEKMIPNDISGISAYLQTFKGIGPTTAKRITDKFGLDSLQVIKDEPLRLLEVKGISEEKLSKIMENFSRNEGFENLCKFLSRYDVSSKKCAKIYEKFGAGAEKKINENPYILCDEIERISFLTSDVIAKKMNFPLDHYYRLEAGTLHILKNAAYKLGHLFLYEQELIKAFNKLFPNIDNLRFEEILEVMEKKEKIARIDDKDKIYLPKMLRIEDYVARKTIKLCGSAKNISNLSEFISEAEKENNIKYAEKQIEGIEILNSGSSFSIITGGPGTGKSTIIKAILSVLKKDNPKLKVNLAAPTGRAAKRMEETTKYSASTIHRLLEVDPINGFKRNSENPLNCDVLIVDESSMIDMELFCNLINAIKLGTRLILVGDIDQLPPVGIGYVFRDLIESKIVPVVKLNKVFRQGDGSLIKVNAGNIREGNVKLEQRKGSFEIYCYQKQDDMSDIKRIQNTIVQLFKKCYSEELEEDKSKAIYQLQILTPMKNGPLGTNKLNQLIQSIYNPPSEEKREYSFFNKNKTEEYIYREGDKVMQIANDYEKYVFNGDLGIIDKIYSDKVMVNFENDVTVEYDKGEVRDNLILAYACTVHKSQGSEYNQVIVVSSYAHSIMRQRNLYYTAITRAKKTVYTLGDKQSIIISIKTIKAAIRNSKLKERLEIYNSKKVA